MFMMGVYNFGITTINCFRLRNCSMSLKIHVTKICKIKFFNAYI